MSEPDEPLCWQAGRRIAETLTAPPAYSPMAHRKAGVGIWSQCRNCPRLIRPCGCFGKRCKGWLHEGGGHFCDSLKPTTKAEPEDAS